MKMTFPASLIALLSVFFTVAVNAMMSDHETPDQHLYSENIRQYARMTFGDRLPLSSNQIKQLSWVLENAYMTPEMDTVTTTRTIHLEVPRALSRLYCLRLLKAGSDNDYQLFIAPQIKNGATVLTRESFTILSEVIGQLDSSEYNVLEAATIISSVTLSPEAIKRARTVMGDTIPADSMQFLAATAHHAIDIYPLAKLVISQTPEAQKQFETVFMPDSHLRHMMYNEGSLSMYTHLKNEIESGGVNTTELTLWYAHWLINIAGFRGHLDPNGSLYLDENTFRAAHQLYNILTNLFVDNTINPISTYLHTRTQWLGLQESVKDPTELLALGSLATTLRLFTNQQGRELSIGYNRLSDMDRINWQLHVKEQMQALPYPTQTYAPALFANVKDTIGLIQSIEIVIPIYLQVLEVEKKIRKEGKLSDKTPVSFRELARKENIKKLLHYKDKAYTIDIDLKSGVVQLLPPQSDNGNK